MNSIKEISSGFEVNAVDNIQQSHWHFNDIGHKYSDQPSFVRNLEMGKIQTTLTLLGG